MERFKINPQADTPINDATLLGHDKVVNNIFKFTTSEDAITPLSIALHGDWGSGKTSIMYTLQQKLADEGHQPLFFEAWKHEYTNPALALVETIALHFERKGKKELAKEILDLAVHIVSKKFLDLELREIEGFFRRSHDVANTMSNQLETIVEESMGGKKLIVIIDDLDRCDVENTLMVLSMMKLFLDIKNTIFIAAVDFNRLQHAWQIKYGGLNPEESGRDYLEKIFQVRIGIPIPENSQIREYVQELIIDMPYDLLAMFGKIGPHNPRGIKRMLNNISYRSLLLNSDHAQISASLWTLLEDILGNKKTVQFYRMMKENLEGISFFFRMGGDWDKTQKEIHRFTKNVGNTSDEENRLSQYIPMVVNLLKKLSINHTELEKDFDVLCVNTNELVR